MAGWRRRCCWHWRVSRAEGLLLLLHYGIDWSDGDWVTGRCGDYWESVLPSRVRVATFTAADLHHWWALVSAVLRLARPHRGRG